MNRRELLTSTLNAVAAAGVPGVTVETVEAEPLPLLLVLRHPKHLSFEARKCLKESFCQVFKDKPPCPIVLLEEGVTLQAITDPRGSREPKTYAKLEGQEQIAALQAAVAQGALTVNEARAVIGLGPLEGQ